MFRSHALKSKNHPPSPLSVFPETICPGYPEIKLLNQYSAAASFPRRKLGRGADRGKEHEPPEPRRVPVQARVCRRTPLVSGISGEGSGFLIGLPKIHLPNLPEIDTAITDKRYSRPSLPLSDLTLMFFS